jgi:hypothetical protein
LALHFEQRSLTYRKTERGIRSSLQVGRCRVNGLHYKRKSPPEFDRSEFEEAPETDNESGPGQETFKEKFLKSILDQGKDYPLPVPVVSLVQNGESINLLTLKSFSLWQGKQKSKKTTVLALAVAAFLRGILSNIPQQGVHFIAALAGTVLFFDTEQGQSYAARTMRLILKLVGVESIPNLIYCDLREYSPTERMEVIKAGRECTPDVKMVVIDGLVDLMNDFMDAGEGHLTITDLIKLCSIYNIHVDGVLHKNKNDKNARAHIGTISSKKCEMEITTEKDENDRARSIVSCLNSRDLPFEPFAIRWDKGSLPCIAQEWNSIKSSDTKANKNYERSKEIAEAVFKPLVTLSHSESIKELMSITLKSESTAKRMLNDFLGWGLILKGADGNYRINMKEGSRVQEGSNEGSFIPLYIRDEPEP